MCSLYDIHCAPILFYTGRHRLSPSCLAGLYFVAVSNPNFYINSIQTRRPWNRVAAQTVEKKRYPDFRKKNTFLSTFVHHQVSPEKSQPKSVECVLTVFPLIFPHIKYMSSSLGQVNKLWNLSLYSNTIFERWKIDTNTTNPSRSK